MICFHKNCPGLLVKLALNACVWFGRVYIFSVITVVEYHSGADKIQYIFASNWAASKDFLLSCKRTWFWVVKDSRFSVFNVNFEPKMNLIILKINFVLECQTRRTTFCNNIFSFIHVHQILFILECALFLLPLNWVILQNIKKFFENVHLDVKIY